SGTPLLDGPSGRIAVPRFARAEERALAVTRGKSVVSGRSASWRRQDTSCWARICGLYYLNLSRVNSVLELPLPGHRGLEIWLLLRAIIGRCWAAESGSPDRQPSWPALTELPVIPMSRWRWDWNISSLPPQCGPFAVCSASAT